MERTDGKKTKVIATLGPACMDPKILREMLKTGVDMIRINASHIEDPKTIPSLVKLVTKASKVVKRSIGVFLDLQGPKIRLGAFIEGEATLTENQLFTLTSRLVEGTEEEAHISYENFSQDVKKGDIVFIDDGKVHLQVNSIQGEDVSCKVIRGGKISNHKGVNLPMTEMSVSPFTEKDKKDAYYAIKANVDYIALSFVSSAEDIHNFRGYLDSKRASNIRIIAKIERQKAVDNLSDIIDAADVVMVARGDLGVEVGVEKVPKIQKHIIHECNKRLKPVVVATQMLETMIHSEIATRAEVSDVANAVYDNCDAVMLSGETAVGVNPIQVIQTMQMICKAADVHLDQLRQDRGEQVSFSVHSVATSFCKAATQVARENNAKVIMAFTSSGNTPLISSKTKTRFPIIAPTDESHLCRRMSVYKGVTPMLLPKKFKQIGRWTDMIKLSVKECVKLGYLQKGDVAVITAGIPIGQSNGINSIRIITV